MTTTLPTSTPPITDNNREPFVLIWLDDSVNEKKENIATQEKLRTSINNLKTFRNSKECEQYIQSLSDQERIVLIVSGRLGQEIVPQIHQLQQIFLIYIFCMNKFDNEKWSKHFPKVN
jgi:response regulator RpfG family c-di-GMP phosphodiesterase